MNKAITIIHVNQHNIRRNRKTGSRDPCITVKSGRNGKSTYYEQLQLEDSSGQVLVKVVYSPGRPLKCGAVVWLETALLPREGRTLTERQQDVA